MNRFQVGRLTLAAVGVVVWGYGHRMDLPRVRLVGIAILIVASLLRLVPKRLIDGDDEKRDPR